MNITVANVNHRAYGKRRREPDDITEDGAAELHGTGDDTDTGEASGLTFQWTQVPQIGEPAVTLIPIGGSAKDVAFTAPTIGGGDPNGSLTFTSASPLGTRAICRQQQIL